MRSTSQHDVFLSHSAKDKAVALTLAERLSGEFKRFADEELRTGITLLAGSGVV